MVWALLARFLIKQPPVIQAVVLGLCTGLFVAAGADANNRDPVLRSTIVLVLIWGAVAAVLFYVGLVVRRRRGWEPAGSGPRWLYAIYSAVWAVGLVAALLALLGEGGFKVAVLAVVPLVLLAPTALHGFRVLLTRRGATDGGIDGVVSKP